MSLYVRPPCRQCGHLTAQCNGCGKYRRRLYKGRNGEALCFRCLDDPGPVTVAHPVDKQGRPVR